MEYYIIIKMNRQSIHELIGLELQDILLSEKNTHRKKHSFYIDINFIYIYIYIYIYIVFYIYIKLMGKRGVKIRYIYLLTIVR